MTTARMTIAEAATDAVTAPAYVDDVPLDQGIGRKGWLRRAFNKASDIAGGMTVSAALKVGVVSVAVGAGASAALTMAAAAAATGFGAAAYSYGKETAAAWWQARKEGKETAWWDRARAKRATTALLIGTAGGALGAWLAGTDLFRNTFETTSGWLSGVFSNSAEQATGPILPITTAPVSPVAEAAGAAVAVPAAEVAVAVPAAETVPADALTLKMDSELGAAAGSVAEETAAEVAADPLALRMETELANAPAPVEAAAIEPAADAAPVADAPVPPPAEILAELDAEMEAIKAAEQPVAPSPEVLAEIDAELAALHAQPAVTTTPSAADMISAEIAPPSEVKTVIVETGADGMTTETVIDAVPGEPLLIEDVPSEAPQTPEIPTGLDNLEDVTAAVPVAETATVGSVAETATVGSVAETATVGSVAETATVGSVAETATLPQQFHEAASCVISAGAGENAIDADCTAFRPEMQPGDYIGFTAAENPALKATVPLMAGSTPVPTEGFLNEKTVAEGVRQLQELKAAAAAPKLRM